MDLPFLMDATPPGVVMIEEHDSGNPAELGHHRHALGQLTVIDHGLMAVDTGSGWWVLPPGRVGWLPPAWPHAGRGFGAVRAHVLYVDAARAAALPRSPTVLALSAFLTALVDRLHNLGADAEGRRGRLLDVLCDEVAAATAEKLHLPLPTDPRLARMCRHLIEHPDDPRDLSQWAASIGLSRRSLSRHMIGQTGLSLGRWRTQARLMAAIRLLADRRPVTEVALSLGFDSVSSFIAGFRRHFGTTPARYLDRAMPDRRRPVIPPAHE